MRRVWLVLWLLLGVAEYPAVRTPSPPVVDGDLSDPVWAEAPPMEGFVQRDPDEGQPASQRTVVRLLYDDRALYVGAYLYDDHPVTSLLGRRDAVLECDWFRVYLDPRLDGRTGATFQVNPANVQYDAALHSDAISDPDWDAVWQSAARIVKDGWIVEMSIPLSQLRFLDRPVQTWGINLGRVLSRRNEVARLVFTPKDEAGFVSRFAHLTGLEGLRPRGQLELLPYAAVRMDRGEDGDGKGLAGLDFKRALPGSLTLTGTVNPDFGQVEVDPARVNLTQYELFFPEKRPFFVEGGNLFDPEGISNHVFDFNFTSPLIFYSRRIGRPPRAADLLGVEDAPEQTTILGAAKVTGKTGGGWTVAALDAVTAREDAALEGQAVEVEPLTNYFVGRVAKDLGGRSAVGLRTTAVHRDLTPLLDPLLPRTAYVAAADGYRTFHDNTFVLQWTAAGSRVEGSAEAVLLEQRSSARYYQRPDAAHVEVDPARTSLSGAGGSVLFAKHAGRWQYNLQTAAYSPGFETNDAGFLPRSDILTSHAVLLFSDPHPGRRTRSRSFWVGKFQHWNWDGDLIQNGALFEAGTLLPRYQTLVGWGGIELETVDDRTTRGGPAILRPERRWIGGQAGTDSRKSLSLNVSTEILEDALDGWSDVFAAGLTFRPGSRLSLRLTPSFRTARLPVQYVTTVDGRTVFATLDQTELELAARLDWTFTSRLTFQLYVQPYAATGHYHGFKELAQPRSLDFDLYGEDVGSLVYDPARQLYAIDPDAGGPAEPFLLPDPDFDFESLRTNAVLRWEFARGSALYAVWNGNREETRGVPASPARDVFLIKASYWFGR